MASPLPQQPPARIAAPQGRDAVGAIERQQTVSAREAVQHGLVLPRQFTVFDRSRFRQ